MLKDGTKFLSGIHEAVLRNTDAAKKFAVITRTSLGPNGMNKMVINHLEKLFVTNDAATIMKELDVVHPAAKMLVMAAQQQEAEVWYLSVMDNIIFCSTQLCIGYENYNSYEHAYWLFPLDWWWNQFGGCSCWWIFASRWGVIANWIAPQWNHCWIWEGWQKSHWDPWWYEWKQHLERGYCQNTSLQ